MIDSIIVRMKNGIVVENSVETGEQHIVISDKNGKVVASLPLKEAERLSRAIDHVVSGIYIAGEAE